MVSKSIVQRHFSTPFSFNRVLSRYIETFLTSQREFEGKKVAVKIKIRKQIAIYEIQEIYQ